MFTKNSSVLGKTHAVGCRALGKSQPKIARAVNYVLGCFKAKQKDEYVFTKNSSVFWENTCCWLGTLGKSQPRYCILREPWIRYLISSRLIEGQIRIS